MEDLPPKAITALLDRIRRGEESAKDDLFRILYPDLRHLAQSYMNGERADHTLQATALVHELFFRLDAKAMMTVEDRSSLMALAARMTRNILIEYARAHRTSKRGGDRPKTPVEDYLVVCAEDQRMKPDFLDLDRALEQLEVVDPLSARVAELRHLFGFTTEEIAKELGLTISQVKTLWKKAQARLFIYCSEPPDET
jgi:RNA polymerase sigma factor (TIGR02999 family)